MKEPLGAAVIGLGHGLSHARAYAANPRTRLMVVCDTRADHARAIAAELGAPRWTTDYREVLDDPGIDVVSIATPDLLHPDQCVAAMEAGKHVLCEKPLALTVEGCTRIIEASRRTGMLTMVGQSCRYAPAFQTAHQLICEGAIGELFFVESEYAHHYEHAAGVNQWRIDRRRHPVIGGGCHAVDLLRWIAGDPIEASAYSNHKCLLDWPVDDTAIAILRFPDNIVGKVFISIGCRRPYTMRSTFYGVRGTIICDNTSTAMQVHRHGVDEHDKFSELPVSVANHNVEAEVEELAEALVNGRPLTTDVVEGARTVVVCDAIVEATKTGQPVQVRYPW